MQTLESTLTSFKVPENIPFYDPTEDEQREYYRRRAEMIRKSGIPLIFRDADIKLTVSQVQHWVAGIEAGGHTSLLLQGKVGTGKTYAACAALIALMPDFGGTFVTFDDILDEIEETFGNRESKKSVIARYTSRPVLCIDDLGKSRVTEWTVSNLFTIVDKRWSNNRPTIITTQYDGQKLLQKLTVDGDTQTALAIASRLGQADKVKFAGEDRRIQ